VKIGRYFRRVKYNFPIIFFPKYGKIKSKERVGAKNICSKNI
jgi:hypothetical protein